MNKTSPHAASSSNGLHKTLLFCGTLLLCALVYVFVSLQSVRAPVVVAVLTPPPANAAVSPLPASNGLREAVLLSKLNQGPLLLSKQDNTSTRYTVCLRQDTSASPIDANIETSAQSGPPSATNVAPPDSLSSINGALPAGGTQLPLLPTYTGLLELSQWEGYVRGFTLELEALTKPVESKKKLTDYEMGLYVGRLYKYETSLEEQRKLIHAVLSEMLQALDTKGDVPPAISIVWEANVESLSDGDAITEQSGAILFSAVRTRTGKLLLSLST